MSRTYRTHLEYASKAYGRYWTWKEEDEYIRELGFKRTWWCRLGWKGWHYIDRKCRDRKQWDKPPHWFKQQNRRWERAKVRDAMNAGKEPPRFPKYDQWEWT